MFKSLAGELGFEPSLADPESAVLPLDDSPVPNIIHRNAVSGKLIGKLRSSMASITRLVSQYANSLYCLVCTDPLQWLYCRPPFMPYLSGNARSNDGEGSGLGTCCARRRHK